MGADLFVGIGISQVSLSDCFRFISPYVSDFQILKQLKQLRKKSYFRLHVFIVLFTVYTLHVRIRASKTEVLWCASSGRQHETPRIPVQVCFDFIQPASSVRDLGIYTWTLTPPWGRTFPEFAVLRQIRSICRSLTRPVGSAVARRISFVMPRLDYGNATLAGLPDNQLSRLLQSVLIAAAWLVFLSDEVRDRQSAAPRSTLAIYECHSGLSSSWRCSRTVGCTRWLRLGASVATTGPWTKRNEFADRTWA